MKRVDVSTADGSQIICHYFDNELPSIGDILVIMEPDEEPTRRTVVGVLRGIVPSETCGFGTVLTEAVESNLGCFSLN